MFEEILHLNTNFVSILRAISKKYEISPNNPGIFESV